MTNYQNIYRTFYELPIWQEGLSLLKEVYKVSNFFPKEENYGLTQNLKRSANSVIANIAESHGRFFYADKVRVLYIARGEICETRSHLRAAQELNYLSKEIYLDLEQKYELLEKALNLHIRSLSKFKHK